MTPTFLVNQLAVRSIWVVASSASSAMFETDCAARTPPSGTRSSNSRATPTSSERFLTRLSSCGSLLSANSVR